MFSFVVFTCAGQLFGTAGIPPTILTFSLTAGIPPILTFAINETLPQA